MRLIAKLCCLLAIVCLFKCPQTCTLHCFGDIRLIRDGKFEAKIYHFMIHMCWYSSSCTQTTWWMKGMIKLRKICLQKKSSNISLKTLLFAKSFRLWKLSIIYLLPWARVISTIWFQEQIQGWLDDFYLFLAT